MKKIILSLLVFATVATQAQSFQKGQFDVNVGMGLGNTFLGYSRFVGAGYSAQRMPVINASGEYGITDAVSIGGYLGYTSFKYTWTYNDYHSSTGWGTYVDTYKWSFFILGARGSYHFGQFIKIDNLDCYAGLMTGYNIAHGSYSTTDPYHVTGYYVSSGFGGFAYSVYGGARYRFTDKIGVYGELGYGITVLNLGLNIKF